MLGELKIVFGIPIHFGKDFIDRLSFSDHDSTNTRRDGKLRHSKEAPCAYKHNGNKEIERQDRLWRYFKGQDEEQQRSDGSVCDLRAENTNTEYALHEARLTLIKS